MPAKELVESENRKGRTETVVGVSFIVISRDESHKYGFDLWEREGWRIGSEDWQVEYGCCLKD